MKLARRLGIVVLVNTAGGVIPAVLVFLYHPGAQPDYFWSQLRISLIYSYCIGTLCFLVMGRIAPFLHRLPKVYRIALIAAIYLLLTLVGSLTANGIFLALGWVWTAEFW